MTKHSITRKNLECYGTSEFQNLAIAVNNAYQTNRRMMAYDFMKFVDTIEGKVKQKVMFFKSYNEKDVNWEADKKNHEVFESLLKDPNIVNVKKITLDCLDFIPPEIGQLTDLEELVYFLKDSFTIFLMK